MANRPDALQTSRRSQCSSASVRTTWLYRPDAIQCLTSIRVSASRHNYRKTAATVRTMCVPSGRCVSHPDDVLYKVRTCIPRSTVWTSAFMVRTIKLHIWKLRAPVQPSGRSKPLYGNDMQPKCNHPDDRASPSRRSLVWKLSMLLWKGGCS